MRVVRLILEKNGKIRHHGRFDAAGCHCGLIDKSEDKFDTLRWCRINVYVPEEKHGGVDKMSIAIVGDMPEWLERNYAGYVESIRKVIRGYNPRR